LSNSNDSSSDFIPDPFYIEGLFIEPSKNIIIENNISQNIQPKVMEVLVYLCSKAEEVISSDELIAHCWPNQYISDSPLHKCIAQIRKALGDDPKKPRFIKTVPKKGYVFIAKVKRLNASSSAITFPIKSKKNWTGESPYPGLVPYTFATSELFFGREQVIENINNWVNQITENDTSWLSVSAPVGAGKTSLVYAGVLPLFLSHQFIDKTQQEFFDVLDLSTQENTTDCSTPNAPYIRLLALLLENKRLDTTLTLIEYAELIAALSKSCATGLNTTDNEKTAVFQSKLLTDTNHSRFVLFIDQIERIFDSGELEYKNSSDNKFDNACFFQLLTILTNSKKCFLITATREQFLTKLEQATIENKNIYYCKLPEFSLTELMSIIQKPAELTGVSFEYNTENRESLDSVIIQQLQSSRVPIAIVQFLLAQLYTKKFNQQLTYKTYEELGGIAGCFATFTEQHYQELTPQQKLTLEEILFHILSLNANGEIANTAQACPISFFKNKDTLATINHFINAGILEVGYLPSDRDNKNNLNKEESLANDACIYLAHNSLITTWSRITLWIEMNISTLYIRHDLQIATQRWLYHEKSSHLLIHSNKKITDINHIVASNHFTLSDDEKSLIALSINKVKRTNNIRKTIVAAAVACFMGLAALSISLVQKNDQIATTRTNAENLISFILYDLKDKLEPLGKLELLNIVASKTLNYFELAGTDNLTGTALIQWVEALHILGQVNIDKNNFSEAEAFFNQTKTALDQALANSNNQKNEKKSGSGDKEKLLELTMLANYWLGYSAYLQLDYEKAEPFWENYLQYANTLMRQFPNKTWQLEQSYALNNLGALAEKTQQLVKAGNYFEKSSKIKLALLKKEPSNTSIRSELSDTRSWQSNLQEKAGKLLQAIELLHEARNEILKIHLIENNFKSLESLYQLEHKLALLYFSANDLDNVLNYSKKVEQKLIKLVNNDVDNLLFKEDLIWNQLLLVRVFINQNNIDQSLIHVNKARGLISHFKTSSKESITTQNKFIFKANIYLLQFEAQIMMLLNQQQSAHKAIVEATNLFKKHLSIDIELAFYARLILTKSSIISALKNTDTALMRTELTTIKSLLENYLKPVNTDYKALAIYFSLFNFSQQLQIDKNTSFDKQLLNRYKNSDYNIPDYLLINNKTAEY
jgi:DNA-binding winged helix-turn-helix (wHTH) protein